MEYFFIANVIEMFDDAGISLKRSLLHGFGYDPPPLLMWSDAYRPGPLFSYGGGTLFSNYQLKMADGYPSEKAADGPEDRPGGTPQVNTGAHANVDRPCLVCSSRKDEVPRAISFR